MARRRIPKPKTKLGVNHRTPAMVAATITVRCVYNKSHVKTLTHAEAAKIPKDDGFPLCEFDGGPMTVVKATLKKAK